MNIAITGADSVLGCAVADHLRGAHEVRCADIADADVLDLDAMAALCDGVDRVVHLARASRRDGEDAATGDARILDTALKGTYHVMQAAREAGATQVLQVSDVAIFDGYEDDLVLSEDFVALPDTTAEQQAVHLAEGVGHEFAREQPGFVLTLRLGRLVEAASLAPDTAFDRDWLDLGDAVRAIAAGLELERYDHPEHWGLYNLVADTPCSRFALNKITGGRMGLTPAVDFRAWWPQSPAEEGAP